MKKQDVEFKIGKDTLHGTIFIPDGKGPFPAVIFFHGSGGVGDTHFEAAEAITAKGIIGFAFNYRGCGVSDGIFEEQTVEMGVKDGEVAVEFLLAHPLINKERIGFYGGSFGGYIAAMLCNKFKVKSLALTAPAAYSPDVLNIQRDDDSKLDIGFGKSDSYKEIDKFKGEFLLSICELDDCLPKGMAEKYFDAATSAKKKESYVLIGATHAISPQPKSSKEIKEKLINWFTETL
jgi:dienelactone hydrolase